MRKDARGLYAHRGDGIPGVGRWDLGGAKRIGLKSWISAFLLNRTQKELRHNKCVIVLALYANYPAFSLHASWEMTSVVRFVSLLQMKGVFNRRGDALMLI